MTLARIWHEDSDHAKDGTPFGGPLCNCKNLEPRLTRLLAWAWDEGANSRQCHCFAFSDGECACGNYPSERNPYVDAHTYGANATEVSTHRAELAAARDRANQPKTEENEK